MTVVAPPADEVTPRSGLDVVDLSEPPGDIVAIVVWLWMIAAGAASLLASGIARASGNAFDEADLIVRRLPPIPRAAMGLLFGTGRMLARVGRGAAEVVDPSGRRRTSAQEAAVDAIDDAVPRIVERIVDRLDLTRLIIDHVDLDEILRSIDIDEVARRFPVEDLAGRLDVRELAGRVNLEYLLARVDLAGITLRVIDEIDLPAIIRGSTEDLSGEALDALRFRTMHADQLLSRWRDRFAPGRGNGSPRPRTGS